MEEDYESSGYKKAFWIVTIILMVVGIVIAGYFVNDRLIEGKIEKIRNESYSAGARDGSLFWNSVIIKTVNEDGEIPYIVNNTIQTIPIRQLCQEIQ